MVAYSFKQRFAAPIRERIKIHTMRNDRKRHARIGEELQLYTGMRTKQCRLIGIATCADVQPVRLDLRRPLVAIGNREPIRKTHDLHRFAISDGFDSLAELLEFWEEEHARVDTWEGVIVFWKDLRLAEEPQ